VERMDYYQFHIEDFFFESSHVLKKQTLHLKKQDWTCLIGQSGVGKTTLLRCLLNLDGKSISGSTASFSYMAQTDLLLPWAKVIENVVLGERLRGQTRNYAKALEILTKVGLQKFANFYPHQLSMGMRQRAALARTLMEDREIVLMDEPFAALDAKTRRELQDYAITALKGKTVLLVTHDISEVIRLSNQIYILKGFPAVATLVTEPHIQTILQEISAPRAMHDLHLWQEASVFLSSLYS
jgi:putative hydroxymethylpyrimidine transport system ATP-binding protein